MPSDENPRLVLSAGKPRFAKPGHVVSDVRSVKATVAVPFHTKTTNPIFLTFMEMMWRHFELDAGSARYVPRGISPSLIPTGPEDPQAFFTPALDEGQACTTLHRIIPEVRLTSLYNFFRRSQSQPSRRNPKFNVPFLSADR